MLISLALLSFKAFADPITREHPLILVTSGPTVSSIYVIDEIIKCSDKEVREATPQRCAIMSTIGVLSTTTYFAIWKEEVAQVQPDMYAFLAGENMSLALEEVLKKARENTTDLPELSDEDLTVALINLIELT